MELLDKTHKEVHRDWLAEAIRAVRLREHVRAQRRAGAENPRWGSRLVRYL